MWYYGGMDVPFVDPTLINGFNSGFGPGNWNYGPNVWNYGLNTPNYGLNTPFYGTPKMTWGDFHFDNKIELLPLGGIPYGTTHLGYNPFVNTFVNPFFKTATTPIFGLNTYLPTTWGTPIGFDKLGFSKMNWGFNPFFTNTFGFSPVEELYKSTYGNPFGWNTPYLQTTLPFTPSFGAYGTPYYGFNQTVNPLFINGIEEKIKFQTPFTTGSFGLYNTFNTPIDWKMKTFGTPVGLTTETWNKPVGFPWKSSVISGPVAVL